MEKIIPFIFPLPDWSIWTIRSLFGIIFWLTVYFGRNYFIASRKFRDYIFTELNGLYPTPAKWPVNFADIDIILREKYSRMEIAVSQFKGHLPCFMVKGFQRAWVRYYNKYSDDRCQNYIHYTPFKSVMSSDGTVISRIDNAIDHKALFKKNIDGLLKYARQI